jgi:small nuclear ribonucleoprotein D2
MSSATKPKSEMSEEELQKKEEEEFNTGPLSLLTQAVKHNTQVSEYITDALDESC